jgi:hypothetical protein
MKTLWILYCALQAVPANEPTAHSTFDTEANCLRQSEVSNSFNELHCVCAREGFARELDDLDIIFDDTLSPPMAPHKS